MANLENSFIGLANFHVFPPGSDLAFDCVQSRFLCWCCSGSGTVTVNGSPFEMTMGSFVFAPWNHSISYHSSSESPMVVGTIHVIPEIRGDAPPAYEVYDKPHPKLPEYCRRYDVPLPGFEKTVYGWFQENSRLAHFMNYVIRAYQDHPSWEELRDMVNILIREVTYVCYPNKENKEPLPVILQDMLNYIESHVECVIETEDLMQRSRYSRPTVFRLFRQFLHTTPGAWIYKQKMRHAAHLLLTTPLTIGEISARVAIHDCYYFSKLFRKYQGMTAIAYRKAYSVNMLF